MKRFGFVVAFLLVVGLVTACAPNLAAESPNAPISGEVDITTTVDYNDDDIGLQWPDFLQILALVGAGASLIYGNRKAFLGEEAVKWLNQSGWIVLMVIFFVASGLIVVPVSTAATIRQSVPTSNIYSKGPGLHWATPIVSKVNYYTTRVRSMNINNIQADTSSPGRPQVFPDVTVWFQLPITDGTPSARGFTVDEKLLVELDLLFGPEYEAALISKRAITAVKEIVGDEAYDYVGNNRIEAQERILKALQKKLGNLVVVTSVEVVNYSFTPEFDQKLNELSQKQIEEESAKRDASIAENKRIVAEINQQTRELEGQGEAKYNIMLAEADAKKILLKAEAQASAYKLIAEQLSKNPDLLSYEYLQRWDGRRPYVESQGGESFMYQLPSFNPTPIPAASVEP